MRRVGAPSGLEPFFGPLKHVQTKCICMSIARHMWCRLRDKETLSIMMFNTLSRRQKSNSSSEEIVAKTSPPQSAFFVLFMVPFNTIHHRYIYVPCNCESPQISLAHHCLSRALAAPGGQSSKRVRIVC